MAISIVNLESGYYPFFDKGKPIADGALYVGTAGTDPEVLVNQIPVSALQSNGSTVSLAQPISLSAGGVPEYNGSPVVLTAKGDFSIKVLDKQGAQVFYWPNRATFPVGAGVTNSTFATVDLAKAATFTLGQSVYTQENTSGNGGGALYVVDALGTPDGYGDHATDDGNFQITLQTDGPVNVKQFGATGDGLTNDSSAIQAAIDHLIALSRPGGVLYFPNGDYVFTGLTATKQVSIKGDTSAATSFTNAVAGGDMLTITYSGVADVAKRNVIKIEDVEWVDEASETGRAIVTTDVFFLEFNRCFWRNFASVRAVQLDETLWVSFNFCNTDRAEIRIKSITTPHNSNVISIRGGEYRNPTTQAFDISRADVVAFDGVTVEGDSGNTTSPVRGLTLNEVDKLHIDGMYMEVLRTGDSGMKLINCRDVEIRTSLLGSSSATVPAVHLEDTINVQIAECSSAAFFLRTTGDCYNVRIDRASLEGRLDIADGNDVRFTEIYPEGPVIIPVNPEFQSTMDMGGADKGVLLKNWYTSSSFKQTDPTGTTSGAATATYKTDGGYLDDYSLQLDFTGVQQAVFGSMGTTDAANQGAIITFMAMSDIDADFDFTGSIFSAIGGDRVNVTPNWRRYFLFTSLSSAISGTAINLIISSTESSQLLIDDIQTLAYSSLDEAAKLFANFRHIQTFGSPKATLADQDQRDANFIILPKDDRNTISGGAITVDASSVVVDTESSAATDDLDTINGVPDGGMIFVRPLSSARTVVLKDGTGNLSLAADITLDNVTDVAALINIGGFLREFSSRNNGI